MLGRSELPRPIYRSGDIGRDIGGDGGPASVDAPEGPEGTDSVERPGAEAGGQADE